MRSKNKSALRTALTYIGILICVEVLVALLLSFLITPSTAHCASGFIGATC